MPNYSLAFLRNWTNLKIEIVPIGTVKLFRVNVNVIFVFRKLFFNVEEILWKEFLCLELMP